jgi:hypothetical protein
MVERSIAWLIGPKGRWRKLCYRGANANDWWLHTRVAALNLRRMLNPGLHRRFTAFGRGAPNLPSIDHCNARDHPSGADGKRTTPARR